MTPLSDGGGLPGLSVRRPFLAAVMNLMIVIAGIGALWGVEVRELPDVDRPIVSVRANYPGASPTTVDAEVTSLVEGAVARVSGVVSVRSSSEEGNFRLHAEFRPGQDLAVAANDVREAVSRVVPRLPDGVEDLFVVKSEQDAWPIMQVAVRSESMSIDALTRQIEDAVIPELTAVDGVAEVSVFGDRERVLRVEVSPARLAAFGLSIGEVARVLEAAQFDVPVGSFEAEELEVLVRADATVSEPSEIERLMVRDPVRLGDLAEVLRVEVSPARLAAFGLSIGEVARVLEAAQFDVPVGSFEAEQLEVLVRADATVSEPSEIERLMVRDPVRLGDLAEVYFSPATPESIARLDGRLVLSLGIVRQAHSNTVRISGEVQRALRLLEQRFPDMRFQVTSDDAVFIRGAIVEVLATLGLALVIVVGVIWLFLGRLGATLVPAVAIPVALTGSVAAIWLLGFSVNLITLLALVLATGLVVDDAIVVTENIQRRRVEGMGPKAAAVVGARQVFFAVIATTVTLVAVFIPISFLPGTAGRLFTEFGYVLAITVSISSFVALSLCPMLASRIGDLGGAGGLIAPLGRALGGLYGLLLRPVLAMPLVALTVAGLAAATAGLVYGELGEELVPPEDRGIVTVRMQGPDGVGLDNTDRQVEAVERMLAPWVESGLARGLYSITGRYDPNRGEVGARLIPWDQRTVSQAEIEAALWPQLALLPGAQARIQRGNSLGLRRGSDGGLSLALTGPSYPKIAEAAVAFAARLGEIPGVSGIRVQYQATQPQLSIRIDRARAADLGVAMSELSATLRALIDEDQVAELTIEDQAVPILLQSAAGAVRDPADLLNLYVRAESGQLIALSQLVTFSEEGVAAELDPHVQRRAIEIDAAIATGLPLRQAVDAVRAMAHESLPPGIGLIFLGDAATLDETSSELMATYVIALVVVFLVLVAQFESLTSALVVMVTVPFGVCAAVYALWLTGTTVNIYSQIGVLMLIGIMAKNGILLVEFADQLRDRGQGAWEAAYQAARVRLRAIAMTLTSTVLAGLPLILGSGPGAEARASIGWVVFGGLGVAAGFTLFLTPAAYALIAGLSRPRAAVGAELEAELASARGQPAGE